MCDRSRPTPRMLLDAWKRSTALDGKMTVPAPIFMVASLLNYKTSAKKSSTITGGMQSDRRWSRTGDGRATQEREAVGSRAGRAGKRAGSGDSNRAAWLVIECQLVVAAGGAWR